MGRRDSGELRCPATALVTWAAYNIKTTEAVNPSVFIYQLPFFFMFFAGFFFCFFFKKK